MYKFTPLTKPCRNFMVLKTVGFTDPRDQKAKFAFAAFANFVSGTLFLIDPKENTAERYPLPCDNGAWAILNYHNETLLLGTCTEHGVIHRFDLATRTFAEPLSIGSESYLWNMVEGADGMVYAGTYPGCILVRYDPKTHTYQELGRASENEKNLYTRYVAPYGDDILVDYGQAENGTVVYSPAKGRFLTPDETGDVPTAESLLTIRDKRIATGDQVVRGCLLPDGSLIDIFGQFYDYYEGDSVTPIHRRIPGDAPATAILSMVAGDDGRVWGCSNFGITMFCYDPTTGTYENTTEVGKGSGEIYGMVARDGKLYLTTYANGFHTVYDPSAPWDMEGNVNPKTLRTVGPAYDRPHAKSVLGPNGSVWTGWMADYGRYGGALSRIDTTTGDVQLWEVGDSAIAGIAADDKAIYYVTFGQGNGLKPKAGPFHLVAVDDSCRELRRLTLPEDVYPNTVHLQGDLLYVSHKDCITVYRKADFAVAGEIEIPRATSFTQFGDKIVVFSANKSVYAVDPTSFAFEKLGETEHGIHANHCTCVIGDTLYYADALTLWKMER